MEENNRKEAFSKKRRNRNILYLGIGIFLILYTLFWKTYSDFGSTAGKLFKDIQTNNKRDTDIAIEADQPISFAFLGIDNGAFDRGTEQGRSDAILVGTVNPKTRTTTLVSLPRDAYALMEGYETASGLPFYDKLTHAYAYGDAEMAINSIQELIDIPIDYYVEVNMQGLIDIVNALGGIEVTSPLTFEYMTHEFIKGETRTFSGKDALAFSRMRKEDPQGDFGRQKREKLVIRAIMDKILSLESVANYQSILQTLEENVKTNLTFKEMIDMVSSYRKSLENFEQDNLLGEELWLNEVYYLHVLPEDRLELSNKLRKELEIQKISLEDLYLTDADFYVEEGYYEDEQGYEEGYDDAGIEEEYDSEYE